MARREFQYIDGVEYSFLLKCHKCKGIVKHTYVASTGGYFRGLYRQHEDSERWSIQADAYQPCPLCGAPESLSYDKPIKGRFNADVPCDGRCTRAKGSDCECSCGGANHGSAWS